MPRVQTSVTPVTASGIHTPEARRNQAASTSASIPSAAGTSTRRSRSSRRVTASFWADRPVRCSSAAGAAVSSRATSARSASTTSGPALPGPARGASAMRSAVVSKPGAIRKPSSSGLRSRDRRARAA